MEPFKLTREPRTETRPEDSESDDTLQGAVGAELSTGRQDTSVDVRQRVFAWPKQEEAA